MNELPVAAITVTRQVCYDGLVNGLSIGLLALGIVLIYRSSRVINFAVGAIGALSAAVLALLAISPMLAVISSVAAATVCKFRVACSAAAATTLACTEVSSVFELIWWLIADSSCEELASTSEFCPIRRVSE